MPVKINKNNKFTEVSTNDLLVQLDEYSTKLQKLQFSKVMNAIENVNDIKLTRMEIARFKTEIRAREIESKVSK